MKEKHTPLENVVHNTLTLQGYEVYRSLDDSKFSYGLAHLAIDLAMGPYVEPKLVPLHIAVQGTRYIPANELHLLYAKILDPQEGDPQSIRLFFPGFYHKEDKTGHLVHPQLSGNLFCTDGYTYRLEECKIPERPEVEEKSSLPF